MNKRPWIVFFSQTGSEIGNLISSLDKVPDCIITNKNDATDISPLLKKHLNDKVSIVQIPNKPEVKDYQKVLKKYKNPLVTLHGYLRIIPKEICSKYEIYNLHPGLITEYPELKGKDPQQRAYEGKYPQAGCVIHRVIPEVDEGKIVSTYPIFIENYTLERIIEELRFVGLILWKEFFKNYDK